MEIWDQWAMSSFFAKANYTYDRRYLIEGTIRRDGSSRFEMAINLVFSLLLLPDGISTKKLS